MNTEVTTNTENKSRVREVVATAGKLAETGIDIVALKKRVENAVEDAVVDAERLAKRGQHAMEDVVDDTTYYIKKNPWRSVGYAAGAGLGVGLIAGLFFGRRNGSRDQ